MMMETTINFNTVFEQLADWLDIPTSYFERAESRYHSIAAWLSRPESTVRELEPDIFAQGSFSLGTMIKPITDEEQYDIDLVCQLDIDKNQISQKWLKEKIGYELALYTAARQMLSEPEERRRCWQMHYADQDVGFHLDVLPAIPKNQDQTDKTIVLTDNKSPSYEESGSEWPHSNPAEYAEWFQQQMEIQLKRQKELAEYKASVGDVPKYKIKTPLQRVIQLLKRHRDSTYEGEEDDKPISILITTLAARAYDNESDIPTAFQNIVWKMRDLIEEHEGIYWVPNPVDPDENFADKWQEYPQRKAMFFNWLDRIELDAQQMVQARSLKSFRETLNAGFGQSPMQFATKSLNSQNFPNIANQYPLIEYQDSRFDVSHKEKPNWPMQLTQNVYIRAVKSRNGFRMKNLPKGGQVEKHWSLKFMAQTNTSKPYDVFWQVVNTGGEAAQAHSLRGEFYEGFIQKGRRIRRESTLYVGTHWVECFIIKNDVCVARSGEFVINVVG